MFRWDITLSYNNDYKIEFVLNCEKIPCNIKNYNCAKGYERKIHDDKRGSNGAKHGWGIRTTVRTWETHAIMKFVRFLDFQLAVSLKLRFCHILCVVQGAFTRKWEDCFMDLMQVPSSFLPFTASYHGDRAQKKSCLLLSSAHCPRRAPWPGPLLLISQLLVRHYGCFLHGQCGCLGGALALASGSPVFQSFLCHLAALWA